jgi:acyl-coenzyme A synthetase/AMP-(fatty) acid ligase
MSEIKFLLDRFLLEPDSVAVVSNGVPTTYKQLHQLIQTQIAWLNEKKVRAGTPIILKGDYSPLVISMLLALIEQRCIVIPLTPDSFDSLGEVINDVGPACIISMEDDKPTISGISVNIVPELYEEIRSREAPGLVLFTSGSSGKPKAVVHDFSKLMIKFYLRRPAMITLNFLLFDHWGGLNTLFHCLSNLCLIVMPQNRTPDHVCLLIEQYRIELLPATPSFLNMLLLSRAYKNHDLSSLKLITYGAEPMSDSTLKNLRKVFPCVEMRQTYGMIELGVLRAKSRDSDSLWLKLGGDGYDLRVVDGILQVRADSAMLGYINAESPFTEDGFFITGDLVECDGEWIRILGRESDIINVGGQKVYPAEVESTLLKCPEVADAVVYGEVSPILGKVVCATVVLHEGIRLEDARSSILRFCRARLMPFMVPFKLVAALEIPQSHRLKRVRRKV